MITLQVRTQIPFLLFPYVFTLGRDLEVNLANNASAWRKGHHPGYENTAWEGIQQTIDVIAQKGIRVVINGGALDPKALALRVQALVGFSSSV